MYISREHYNALLNAPKVSPRLVRAMAFLGHELGHGSPAALAYTGTANATGGVDFDQERVEVAADRWAANNMRRLYNKFGFRPHQARGLSKKSIADIAKFRAEMGL